MDRFPTPPNERQTIELLGQIREGDQTAWEDLYRRYHDELLFAVRSQLGSRLRGFLESEDVLQSVALEAFKALPKFVPRHEGSLRHFLHRLVVNKIRDRADFFQAKKRSGAVPLTDSVYVSAAAKDDEPQYYDGERYDRLERCMAQLPEAMRQVVLLRKIDGLSSLEAAKNLGRSNDATRKLYSRALARLTALMQADPSS